MTSVFARSHVVWLLRYAVQLQHEAAHSRDEPMALRRAEMVREIANRVEVELRDGTRGAFTRAELDLLNAEEQSLTRRADTLARRADRSGADLKRSEEWLVLARALREVGIVVQSRLSGGGRPPQGAAGEVESR